jgi:hypothetical protein
MSAGEGSFLRLVTALPLLCSSVTCFAADEPARSASKQSASQIKIPFSAVLVEYHREHEDTGRRTRLYLSNEGTRSESLSSQGDKPNLIVINNYSTDQIWLVNPVQNLFAEFPKKRSENATRKEDDGSKPSLGVLANEPCYGMSGEKQSARAIGETELSVWRCKDNNGGEYLQHFSTLLGVVIRQESQDGRISELQDIKLISASTNYFRPASTLQEISIGELLAGRAELPEYAE